MVLSSRIAVCLLMLLPVACGSSPHTHAGSGTDAGVDAPQGDANPFDGGPDVAPESSPPFAEAPHDPAPQVVSSGGQVLKHPVVVPVFFPNDSDQAAIEKFLADLAKSSYWGATTSEYGVGALTIAPSIVTTSTTPLTSSTAIDQFVSQLVAKVGAPDAGSAGAAGAPDGGVPDGAGGATGDGGVPDGAGGAASDAGDPPPPPAGQALYVLFLPDGVTISDPSLGQSCVSFGGYHSETYFGSGAIYAVIPRCPQQGSLGGMDALTVALSHELVEASTDPHPYNAPAYNQVDDAHAVWDFSPYGELGDMCDMEPQSYATLVGTAAVQLIWSNKAAAAGHDPCVPNTTPAYFNAVPDQPDDLTLKQGVFPVNTRGVKLAVGQTRTIDVHLFSDAPRGPWLVQAAEVGSTMGGTGTSLSLSLSDSFGNNGDVFKLTITRNAPGPIGGGSEFVLKSKDSQTYSTNLWFGYVGE